MKRYFLFGPDATENTGGEQKVLLVGEVDAKQIGEWKAKYPLGIYQVVSESGHVVYFRNPNRNEVNCALQKMKQPLDPIIELASLTVLGGSTEAQTNDTMFLGILNKIKEKLDGQRAVLVDL